MDFNPYSYYWFGVESAPTEPEIELTLGQTGHLNNSKIPFKITKLEGDEVTIRYKNSRQEYTCKKPDLASAATFDPIS